MITPEDVQDLRTKNERLMAELAREGGGLDFLGMLKMRLDYVTDFLVGDDPQRQIEFAMGWERMLSNVLTSISRKNSPEPMPGQLRLVEP